MISKLYVPLTESERKALEDLAITEVRPMVDQARFIIRDELYRRGLLPIPDKTILGDVWISVADRLPDELVDVLVSREDGPYQVAWLSEGEWVTLLGVIDQGVVTHWQPFTPRKE